MRIDVRLVVFRLGFATRFEKPAVNYLGMLKLAMIERYLRLL